MKRISAIFFLALAATVAVAQTDLTTGPGTGVAIPPQTNAVPGLNTNDTRSLTLDECIAEALKHNFDVQVERYAPQMSLYDLYGDYGGWDPTLSVSGKHTFDVSGGGLDQNQLTIPPHVSNQNAFDADVSGLLPWGLQYDFNGNLGETYGHSAGESNLITAFNNTGGSIGVTMTQPLLKNFWVDETRTTIYVAKNRLKYSEQGLRLQLITTVTAVENAYYELIYARDFVTVQQDALTLAQKQLADDRQRVQIQVLAERGGTIEQDEAQEALSRANLIGAQFNLAQAQNTLKNLITDKYTEWHDIDVQPAAHMEAVRQMFDVQDSWSQGLTMRPDLIQSRLDAEQQGLQLKFSKNQLFPELDLIGSYGFNGQVNGQTTDYSGALGQFSDGSRPFYTYGAQISMPLSNAKARNNYKSAKASEQQYLLKLKQFEQNVMVDIDNAVKQAQSKWESVDATHQQRVYAEVALSAEQGKYAAGKSTTFTVLQLQNNLTSARSQEIRSLADYNEALSNLAQQEGSTLKHRNLDIQVK